MTRRRESGTIRRGEKPQRKREIMAIAEIHVTLKPALLDAQGATVLKALRHLGHDYVRDVRIGKHIEVEFDEGLGSAALQSQLEIMCQQLLANPVIEDYNITIGGVGVASTGASTPTPLGIESTPVSPLAAAVDANASAAHQIALGDTVPNPRPMTTTASATPDTQPATVSAPRISSPQEVVAPPATMAAETTPTALPMSPPAAMPSVTTGVAATSATTLHDPFALDYAAYTALSAEEKLAVQGRAWESHGAWIMQQINARRAAWILCVGHTVLESGDNINTYPSDERLAALGASHELVPWVFTRPPV